MVVLVNRSQLRVCIINDDQYPSRWTNTQQTIKTAAALADSGVAVELIIPRPFGQWRTPAVERRRDIEQYYGVHADFTLRELPGLPRTRFKIDEAVHGVLAPFVARRHRHDVVYTRKIVPLAVAIATGQRAIFESHRVLKRHYPWAFRALMWLKRSRNLVGIVTNAQMIADAFADMGFARDSVLVAHNCYDPADLEPRLTVAQARAQLNLPTDRPIVCYAGHIQRKKGIDTVVAMAARTPELCYVICGGFAEDVAVAKQLASAAGASNLIFTGWIDVHTLAPYLYAADVLLIPPTAAPLEQHGNTVLPIKTYTYLAAGRAILAPRLDDIAEVLHHDRNAWLVPADDLDAAVDGARLLCTHHALAVRLAAAAHADASGYTWQARAERIRDFLATRLKAADASA